MNHADVDMKTDMPLDDPVLQVIPEMDRIMIRMRALGLSSEEIAMVTGNIPETVDDKLSEIDRTIQEFKAFVS